eukprot:GHRR01023886.1.p1 GENE.GHRR01023886.1~~GHRR01023886.1.p1  ORF type:complete len:100 (+),score=17.00 GHRR01023886.1:1140-1439(+)
MFMPKKALLQAFVGLRTVLLLTNYCCCHAEMRAAVAVSISVLGAGATLCSCLQAKLISTAGTVSYRAVVKVAAATSGTHNLNLSALMHDIGVHDLNLGD